MSYKLNLRKENYAALADFIVVSFERDLADFTTSFKTMDASYLANFKQAIDEVRKVTSISATRIQQKETTKQLYQEATKLKDLLLFLKKYADRAKIESSMLTKISKQLRAKNIERSVLTLREFLPHFVANKDKLTDMPDGFLDKLNLSITELERLNVLQNSLMNKSKNTTHQAMPIFKNLYNYISEVADAGKIIYKGTHKKDEYTISKILIKMNAADRKRDKSSISKDFPPLL